MKIFFEEENMSFLQYLFRKSFVLSFLGIILSVSSSVRANNIENDIQISRVLERAEYKRNLGAYYWQKGDYDRAIAAWVEEAEIYRLLELVNKEAETKLKIASARIKLNQEKLAVFKLEEIIGQIKEPSLIARAWNQLGNAYSRSGNLDRAFFAYQNSLKSQKSIATLNNLALLRQNQANYARLKEKSARKGIYRDFYREQRSDYYREALEYASSALSFNITINSLSTVRALIEWQQISQKELSTPQLSRGRKVLASLPSSRDKISIMVRWAAIDGEKKDYWLSRALKASREIDDTSAQSRVLLELGLEAEKSLDYARALELAYLAQLKAQSVWGMEILYRSQWLSARIYRQTGNLEAATANYRNALASLDIYNDNTLKIDIDRRLNFAHTIEPIYREMLGLLLKDDNPARSQLEEALLVADKLRLAQLQQYFGDNCLVVKREISEVKDILNKKNAVAINSIILEEQTHLILQKRDGSLDYRQINISRERLNILAKDWYENLKKGNSSRYREGSRRFYDLIISPFELEISVRNTKTIIFVHDGILRNLPMSALMNGENIFLVEKWASVVSLGLNFQPSDKKNDNLKAAAFGLETKIKGWSLLEQAAEEVSDVVSIVGGKASINENFTRSNLQEQLNQDYSIVHLTTHGYFGGIAENSFILAFDESIDALELEELLSTSQFPIDLLVLSACETAVGSDFSVLGLSGLALRSGVGSVLGTLWAVQDVEQAQLVKSFYQKFEDGESFDKALALQQVQIEHLERNVQPRNWAAVSLID